MPVGTRLLNKPARYSLVATLMSKLNRKVLFKKHMSSITITKAVIRWKRSNKFKITELQKNKTCHCLWLTEPHVLTMTRICQRSTKLMTRKTTPLLKVALSPRLSFMASAGRLQDFKIDVSHQRKPPIASIRRTDPIFVALSHHPVRKTTSCTVNQMTENLLESACLHAMACLPRTATLKKRSLRQ